MIDYWLNEFLKNRNIGIISDIAIRQKGCNGFACEILRLTVLDFSQNASCLLIRLVGERTMRFQIWFGFTQFMNGIMK